MGSGPMNWLFQKLRFPIDTEGKDRILFNAPEKPTGGVLKEEIKFSNRSQDRYIFKIQCTSNDRMSVVPIRGSLKAGETVLVKFIHVSNPRPPSGQHWFGVQLIKSTDEKPVEEVFKKTTAPDFNRRFYVEFENEWQGIESFDVTSEDKETSTTKSDENSKSRSASTRGPSN